MRVGAVGKGKGGAYAYAYAHSMEWWGEGVMHIVTIGRVVYAE